MSALQTEKTFLVISDEPKQIPRPDTLALVASGGLFNDPHGNYPIAPSAEGTTADDKCLRWGMTFSNALQFLMLGICFVVLGFCTVVEYDLGNE